MKFGVDQAPLTHEQDWRFTRVLIARMFPGWTLEHIDALPYRDVLDVFAVDKAIREIRDDDK